MHHKQIYLHVDGHGNFGSIDGDSAAAMRYTEARLSRYGKAMLQDIQKNTVDFVPNYDEKELEPKEMSGLIPNLFANGVDGIAVGFSTKIPPHNLNNLYDVMDYAIQCALDGEEYTVDGLIEKIQAPDFPTGGILIDNGGVAEMYKTGHGKFIIKSKYEIEDNNIIISEIPYQVNKAKFVQAIDDLSKDQKNQDGSIKSKSLLPELKEVRDESDRNGMRIVVELKKGSNIQRVINMLLKHTDMQISYSANVVALIDKSPKDLSLKMYVDAFLGHAASIILKRTQYDLDKASARLNIVEGILRCVEDDTILEKVIYIVKDTEDPETELVKIGFNKEQAKYLMDMKLRTLSKASKIKLLEEKDNLEGNISKWNAILTDDTALLTDMKVEFAELREQLADDRKTVIEKGGNAQINEEDLIKEESLIVTLSSDGLIKSVEEKEYKTQNRGGKGVKTANTKEDEILKTIFTVNSKDDILFFSNTGRCHVLKAYKIAKATRTSKGKSINNYITLDADEYIVSMVSTANSTKDTHILFVTKFGIIKRLSLEQLSTRLSVTRVIDFKDNDQLVTACLVEPDSEVMIITAFGKAIRISMNTEGTSQIRPMGRTAVGVRGIKLKNNDIVMDMIKIEKNDLILTVTSNGYGKKTIESEYGVQSRGGSGMIAHKVTEKTGYIVSALAIKGNEELFIVTEQGQIVRIESKSISNSGRSTSGVKVMNLHGDDSIVSTSKFTPEIEEQDNSKEQGTN